MVSSFGQQVIAGTFNDTRGKKWINPTLWERESRVSNLWTPETKASSVWEKENISYFSALWTKE